MIVLNDRYVLRTVIESTDYNGGRSLLKNRSEMVNGQ